MKRFVILICLSGFCLAGLGAEGVRVEKSGASGKLSVDLSGIALSGGNAGLFKKTLEDDLDRSGWFMMVAGKGAITVAGSCNDSGSALSVQCAVTKTATGEEYMSKNFRGESNGARRLAHQVADEIVLAVKGVRGMASSRILMIGSIGGRKDLYMCDADGGNVVQLTRDGTAARSGPGWSPDGNSLVYTSYQSGFPDVYLVDLTTYERRRISAYPGLNCGASFSPDGRQIALTLSKDGNPDLYIISLRGGNPARLTRTRNASESSPSWSPDGSQIVYVSNSAGLPQIYVISEATGEQKRITYRGSENVAPDWGTNGIIAFCRREGGRYQIWITDPETGKEKAVATDNADYEDPSWAPDGRHIVCSRTSGYHSEVYILDTMGDPPVRLTKLQGEWYCPAWSPK